MAGLKKVFCGDHGRGRGWTLCGGDLKKEETRMKLTNHEWFGAGRGMGLFLIWMGLFWLASGWMAEAQAVSTTTVQGTVYLASGLPGTGTLVVSWPAFTTASGQAVAADSLTVTIARDGFVSVNLAPNLGATPAGLYYTAVYYLSDGTTNTQYWVVPAAAQASLGQVQAQLMPAAQAVQAVNKSYVDESIAALAGSALTASGGTLSGPLILSGDPTQSLQAADKHYVDSTFAGAVPLGGGNMTGPLATPGVNGVELPLAGSTQTTLQAAMSAAGTNGAMEIPPNYTGTDGFTNPNGVYVSDLRPNKSQQFERSVKEFGAVCDGSTDDTNALQSALNFAQTHGVALTIPQGTCKTRTLVWHGESMGGMGKQVSALMGFPGQDVLTTMADSVNLLSYTRLHDLTIYVDQSLDASCSAAMGRAPAGTCAMSRLMEVNSIFSPGGNGLAGTVGTGAGWAVGNCAIAMPAVTGGGGNGLRVAEIENLEIAATGVDPMGQYAGAHSTHTCGMYLAQWPQWSEFRNIDIRGLNTGIAVPALPVATPAGLTADSNRWQNITIQATHGFTAAAGSSNVLDNVVVAAGNSAATGEPPTGLVLDLSSAQQGWTVRNALVSPVWSAVTPTLTVSASGGAVTAVTAGPEHGLGFDPYGTQIPLTFSGSCTAQAKANVSSNGTIGTVTVTTGGVGCSATTTASLSAAGTWDTSAPVNLIAGQNMALFGGNLLKGNGGYTVWNAAGSASYGTQLGGGGGNLPGGGTYTALVTNSALGSSSGVDQFPGADFGGKLQACLSTVNATYGGTCDARNFTGSLSMGSNLTISTGNTTILLPCATISTANQVIVTAGTRNVALRGCALRGASTASGSQGGTVLLYSGAGAAVEVGDPTYAADTMGFHMDNVVINTTAASSGTAQGLAAYRTQEMDLEDLYLLGNSNQTGMTLDGTGNYTGGTFFGNQLSGFQTAVNAIGHQTTNSATTDWMNASTFVRLHIDCPTSGGSPVSGTYGINLQQGDGNTFTGGDVEGCSTALHLGANAQNNTIVGLRNENSTNQVVADAGSSYNNWMTGGTMFTGQLTDNGTRNSFLDTFHRSFNGVNGDWYGSQKDATVTNHYRIGIGAGNERGLLDRYQTDYGYRWTMGLSDATAGEQFYQVLDELNNVNRLQIGQYNNGQPSSNNQTVINAAGTGAVVLNGSNNSGTGGVVIGSGGASETTVAAIGNTGNAQFNGTLQVGGASSFAGSTTVRNQADAEIDQFLWAGATKDVKESFIYKDYTGASQWYMVKDATNNWAVNSAIGGLDSFKAYQSTNSGDTYVNASNATGAVRINNESGAGAGFYVYGGGTTSPLYASFTGTAAIRFPGLEATSGHSCLQIDNSGYITNTGATCGTGNTNGTVNVGTSGQIAYYSANGAAIAGTSAVAVTAGGTGASSAAAALANLGGLSVTQAATQTMAGALNAPAVEGALQADQHQSPSGTGNNGIAMSISQCASQTYTCMIQAPALYAQMEAQPWGGFSVPYGSLANSQGPTSSQPIAAVEDLRYGVPQWFFNASVPWDGRHGSWPSFSMSSISAPSGLNAHMAGSMQLLSFDYAGYRNSFNNASGMGDKVNIGTFSLYQYKYAQMQGGGAMGLALDGFGDGDNVGITMDLLGYGGPNTAADEGIEGHREDVGEGGQVFSATVSGISVGADGSETISTAGQTYNGYQGEGRLLIDLSQGYNGAANSNYIASATTVGGNPVMTCGGTCNWDSSFGDSVQTTLTAKVGNGTSSTNTFPQSNAVLQVASTPGFAVGNLACIFDYDYECEKITAVGAGTVTIATARLPHPVGAYVTSGGLTGYAVEFEADRVVPGNALISGLPDSAISSTIRAAWPVMYNSSGNNATLFVGGNYLPGATVFPASRVYPAMGSGIAIGITVSGGAVTGCQPSGGSGYIFNAPPAIAFAGTGSPTTAPAAHLTGYSGGTFTGCSIDSAGAGVSSTATASAPSVNAYDFYPAAKTYLVYNASTGTVDGTFWTEPFAGTIAVKDSVEQPHYFWQNAREENLSYGSIIPTLSSDASIGIGISHVGAGQGQDTEISISNTANSALYQGYPTGTPWVAGYGQLLAPYGINMSGAHTFFGKMSQPPLPGAGYANFVLGVGCGTIGCASWTSPYYLWVLSGGSFSLSASSGGNVPVVSGSPTAGHVALWGGGTPQTLISGAAPTGSGAGLTTGPTSTVANDVPCFADAFGTLKDCGATAGSGTGTVTSFGASSASWPSWMVPIVSNATTTPSLSVSAGPIPTSALASVAGAGAGLTTGPNSGTTTNDAACFADAAGTLKDCGTGVGTGTVTSFQASTSAWPSWIVPTVANATTAPTLTVSAGPIPTSALASVAGAGAGLTTGPKAGTTANDAACFADAAGTLKDCGTGVGTGTVTSFQASTSAWPSWMTPTVANAASTPALGVAVSSIPNSALASPSLTVNGQACTLGTACTVSAAPLPTAFTTLTDGSTVTLATGGSGVTNATLTLSHSTSTRALNVTGLVNGASFTVVLKQDSTGGAALTLGSGCTWYLGTNAGFTASTAPTLTSAANGINLLAVLYDGSNCYANVR
jgi:hypothetical protein